jgi:hypothetical protein
MNGLCPDFGLSGLKGAYEHFVRAVHFSTYVEGYEK